MKLLTRKFTTTGFVIAISLLIIPLANVRAAITDPGFEVETVSGGFTLPTAMTFAPDGRIFVAEKGGSVRLIKNGGLLPTPVITLSDINTFGDRGLIGMAVDPNFSANGYLYLSYTYENTPGSNFSGPKTGRIVRFTVVGDTALESSKTILVGSVGGNATNPSCENFPAGSDCIPSDSMSHSVGGLKFGPDGKLYATFGDGSNFDNVDPRALRAQSLDSLAGKMIRINTDGTAPTTNPFYNGNPNSNRSKVYAYGLRNAFRFNFEPSTGRLFLGDVGWSNWEEVNRVSAGNNYGWPCNEGNGTTSYGCTASGVTNPTYTYPHDVTGAGSITVGAFPSNGAYPTAYNNSLFFGDYAQNWIKRLVIDNNNNVVSVNDFMDNPDGPVDIAAGLDGNIYYLSIYTGELHRITHTSGNRRPIALLSANPTSGLTPLSVSFSAASSTDPDGDPMTFSWNFGDGSFGTGVSVSHTYSVNGAYNATLTVTDDNGSQASVSTLINAGNQAPIANIVTPANGTLYTANQSINLLGEGSDLEDGTLGAAAFHWQVILHHNIHTHYIQEFNGVKNPTITGLDHGDTDVYLEVVLTVTDSIGLTHTDSINLYLNQGGGTGNLISNPSLENEGTPQGTPTAWFKGGYGVNNAIFTYPVAGFDGAKAAQVEINNYTDGNAKWYFDPVFVNGGEEYVFSDYYTSNASTSLFAQFGFSNGTYQYLDLGVLPPTSVPTKVERNIIMPVGVQTFTMFHELNRAGILTVDNFSLISALAPLDTLSPTVSITSPANDDTLSGVVTVIAGASDNVAIQSVELLVDDVVTGTADISAPYEFNFDSTLLTNGPHTISAVAHDTSGNVATATPVNVSVSNGTTPVNLIQNSTFETADPINSGIPENWNRNSWGNHSATFTYPVTGYDTLKAARVEITSYPANGTGDAKWFFNQVPVTPGTAYSYSDHYRSNTISDIIGRYTLEGGSYHYFGLAKEIQPSATWQTVNATFTPPAGATHVTFFHLISSVGFVEIDDVVLYANGSGVPSETNVPIVEFMNPLAGQTVSGSVNITASSTDDTAVTYVFYAVDGIPVTGQLTQSPYTFSWDTASVANGPHLLKATTHDPSGNNSTHTINVVVDNTITPPSGNNLISNPSLEIVGTNNDPQGWLRGGWGTNDRIYTYPVAGIEGVKSAKVEITSYTSGDAKWYFSEVPVTAGGLYTLSHSFRSNVPTNTTIRYTKTDGTFQYLGLQNHAITTNWTTATQTITIPAGVVALTIFHSLTSTGWLEVDNFSLTTGTTDIFAKGMVSLTFDDGWISHYTDALPVLDAEGVDGTFFVVSDETFGAVPEERIQNPSLEIVGTNNDPQGWLRGGWGTNDRTYTYPVAGIEGLNAAKVEITSYTSGDAKWYYQDVAVTPDTKYTIRNSYSSDISSEAVVRYTLADNSVQYVFLATLPSTGATWQSYERVVTTPANVVSMTLFHVLAGVGSLTVDNYSLKPVQMYMDPSQMLAIQSSGHEIAGHSKTHPNLTTLTEAEQQDQIAGSRTGIISMGGTPVDTFAYPYGAYNAGIQTITQNAGYVAARSVDRGFNVKSTDKYALKIQQINRTTTLAEVQAWTTQAAQDKTWLILMFHQVESDTLEDLGTTPSMLQQMVSYIKTANVDIVKMRDGVALMN